MPSDNSDERALLDSLKDFSSADVKRFGIELGVPLHKINEIFKEEDKPQTQGLEIYDYWRKNCAQDLRTKKKKVEDALRKCGHGRAAARFVRNRAPTQKGMPRIQL